MDIKKIKIDNETGEVEIVFVAKNNNDPELQQFYRDKLIIKPVENILQPALIPAAIIQTEKEVIELSSVNSDDSAAPKKRRHRRTKAQIEEDKKKLAEEKAIKKTRKRRSKDEIEADKNKLAEEKAIKKAKRIEEKHKKNEEKKAKRIEEKKNNKKVKTPVEPKVTGEKKQRGRPRKEQPISEPQVIGDKKPEANKVISGIINKATEIAETKSEPEVLENDLIELSEHITIPDNLEKNIPTSGKIDITVPSEEREDMDTEALQIILRKKDSPMYAIKHIKERAGITMDEARIYCNELWRKYQEEMERIKAEEKANATQNE